MEETFENHELSKQTVENPMKNAKNGINVIMSLVSSLCSTFNHLPKLNNRRSSAFPPNLNRNVRTLAAQALSGICIGQNPLRGQRAHKRDLYYKLLGFPVCMF